MDVDFRLRGMAWHAVAEVTLSAPRVGCTVKSLITLQVQRMAEKSGYY